MRKRLIILLWALIGFSLAGCAGGWHWLLDLCSHFRLQYVGASFVLLLLACALRDRRAVLLGIVAGWLNLALWWPSQLPWITLADRGEPRLRIVTVNLQVGNHERQLLFDWLRTQAVDLLVVEELDPRSAVELDQLDPALKRLWAQPAEDAFGLGVWSRLPMSGAPEARELGPYFLASVRIPLTVRGQLVQLFATHPFPPIGAEGSAARDQQLVQLAEWLELHPGPAILAGDLNASPWSASLRELARTARLVDGSHRRWPQPTWQPTRLGILAPLFMLPIDHVLLRDLRLQGQQRGPDFGSDHRPLRVDVVLARGLDEP